MVHCDCGGSAEGPFHSIPIFETYDHAQEFMEAALMQSEEGHMPTISQISVLVPNHLFREMESSE